MKVLEDLGFILATPKSKTARHYAIYQCACGNKVRTRCSSKLIPETKQCKPCGDKQGRDTFQANYVPQTLMAKDKPLYAVWSSQKTRCKGINPKYGGRGLTFSKLWDNDYELWYSYISNLPLYEDRHNLSLTIDRVNNDYGYHPMNLRWATASEQNLNRRKQGKHNE